MKAALLPILLPARLLTAAILLMCLHSVRAEAVSFEVGDPAPMFEKVLEYIHAEKEDESTTGPVLMIFVKDDDNYSGRAIEELKRLAERNKELFEETRVLIVRSRILANGTPERFEIPESWTLARDNADSLYAAYGIIATPTAVVASNEGKILGFHAGYSAGLMRVIQRELLLELRGAEALRTPPPPPNLELQVGRRLAQRGLWERALPYYRQAAEKEPLDAQSLLEMARILVEMEQIEEALAILEQLNGLEGADELIERARAIETNRRQ